MEAGVKKVAMADKTFLKHNTKEVREGIKNMPRVLKLALADGLDHATRSFYSRLYKTRLQGPPGLRSRPRGIFHRFRRVVEVNGKKVFLRQQASRNESIRAIAKSAKDPLDMTVDLYSTSKVAGIHETGGTIRSAGMPIPLNDKAAAMAKNKTALNDLDQMVINGKVFLGRKRKFQGPELLFIIKRAVRIKPRLHFYKTWDGLSSRRDQIMDDAWDAGVRKI